MASGFGTEDVAIDLDKTDLVKNMKGKIERLFTGVKITFDDVSETEQKQWIAISGSQNYRQIAKDYITSLCNPEVIRNFAANVTLDETALENVERETGAAIILIGPKKLCMSGLPYPFVTALSKLESLYTLAEEMETPVERSRPLKEDKQHSAGSTPGTSECVEVCFRNLDIELKITKEDIMALLDGYDIKRINFKRKPKKRKRFVFVQLRSPKEAKEVLQKFDGHVWKGQTLHLTISGRRGGTHIQVNMPDWISSPKEMFRGGLTLPAADQDDDDLTDLEDEGDPDGSEWNRASKGKDKPGIQNQKTGGWNAAQKTPPSTGKKANLPEPKDSKGGQPGPKSPKGKQLPAKQNAKPFQGVARGGGNRPVHLVHHELAEDGAGTTEGESSIEDEMLFASGPEVERSSERSTVQGEKDSPYKSNESWLAGICKRALLCGYSQDDVETAMQFLDYYDRNITYEELETTIVVVQYERSGDSDDGRGNVSARGTPSPGHTEAPAVGGHSPFQRQTNNGREDSVIVIDDDDGVYEAGGNASLDDSVIIVGEQSNDSVCLVDSFTAETASRQGPVGGASGQNRSQSSKVWTEHRSPPRTKPLNVRAGQPGPRANQSPKKAATAVLSKQPGPSGSNPGSDSTMVKNTPPSPGPHFRNQPAMRDPFPAGGCKRKNFSDDEEQTCLLKSYGNGRGVEGVRQGPIISYPGIHLGNAFGTCPRSAAFGAPPQGPELFHIVIDGSNVAMWHGDQGGNSGKVFSCKGIDICTSYFLHRGHQVTIFVPLWRKYRNQRPEHPIRDQDVLDRLEEQGILKFTPARKLPNGHFVASHEDKWVLDLAVQVDGVIVSNDHFREFAQQSPDYNHILTNRLLPFQFVSDIFMPTPDPLGRNGPLLNEFLCKGWEARLAERKHRPQAAPPSHPPQQMRPPLRPPMMQWRPPSPARFQQWRLPPPQSGWQRPQRPVGQAVRFPRNNTLQPKEVPQQAPNRHPDVTADLLKVLKEMFPEEGQEQKIQAVLQNHASETDLNKLTNYCFSALFL